MTTLPHHQTDSDTIILCDTLAARDQRTIIFYILYSMDACGYEMSAPASIAQFSAGFLCSIDPQGDIALRITAIATGRQELDEQIRPLLQHWKLERLSVATRLVLRMALWELMHTNIDIPIIIDEALELAKSFAELDAYKFVNGILDEWVKRNRAQESH